LRAREAIRQFLTQDQRVSQRWMAILDRGRREGASFEAMASRIDDQVTTVYEKSFEALMQASPGSDAAPSSQALEALQTYATLRAEASRELAQGLRSKDPVKIQKALSQARQAQAKAVGLSPAASGAAQSASAPD
jgi:rhomboid protease GluP